MGIIGTAQDKHLPEAQFSHDQYTITRTLRVLSDSAADGPLVVTAAVGVPRLYDAYVYGSEFQAYVLCREITPTFMGGSNSVWVWEVKCTYKTPEPKEHGKEGTGQDTPGQFANPLLTLAEVAWSDETVQVPVFNAYDGANANKAVQNSAGQVFDPPLMKDENRSTLTITRNEAITANHPGADVLYRNYVNSDVWWGQPAGSFRCKSITSSREVKNLPSGSPYPYLKCTYKFGLLASQDISVMDVGDYYQLSMAMPQKPFLDANGNPRKGFLDGAGNALAGPPYTPVYLSFQIYPRKAFGPLNLPQSYASGVQ
jgi:hypothetical protein